LIHTFQTHHDVIPAIAGFSDNRRAISASADGTLRVWDLHDGLELFALDASSIGVGTVRLTPNEKNVFSFSNDGIVKAWDLDKRQIIARYTSQGPVMVGALSADGQMVIAGGLGYLNILKFETGN
jgi:WD40 repeat protein